MKELKDDTNKAKAIKKLWNGLDDKAKDKLKDEFENEMKKYAKDLDEWKKKYNIKDDEVKTREPRIQEKEKSK